MVEKTKKQERINKVSKTAGILGGTLGAGTLATAYLTGKGIDKRYSQMLPEGNKQAFINAIKSQDLNKDGSITQAEAEAGAKTYFYEDDGTTLKPGYTKEYADSMIKQVSENPELFIDGNVKVTENVLTNNGMEDLKTQLTDALTNYTQGENPKITTDDIGKFTESLGVTSNVGITQATLNKRIGEFLKGKGITDETTIKGVTDAIHNTTGQGAQTVFSDGGKVVGKIFDANNFSNTDVAKASAKAAIGDLGGTAKDGLISWRDTIAGNSSLCKGIADKLGVGAGDVATAGIATTVALTALGIGYGCKKLVETGLKKFSQKRKAKEAGLEGPSPKRRVEQQAKAANATRVQMAEDFENTASHGHFKNRG